jgi:hypothetical protein
MPRSVLLSAGAVAAYALVMVTLGWPIRYTVSPQELEVRFGVVRRHLPWDRVIDMQRSNHPRSSPAFSLDRIASGSSRTARVRAVAIASPPATWCVVEDPDQCACACIGARRTRPGVTSPGRKLRFDGVLSTARVAERWQLTHDPVANGFCGSDSVCR